MATTIQGVPSDVTVCSWSQALCSSCVEEIAAEGWWGSKAQSLLTGDPARFECSDCRETMLALADRHGGAVRLGNHHWATPALRSAITAAHEAGHAVVSERSCNMIVDSATIEQQGNSGGRVDWDWDTLNRDYNGVPFERYAVAMFAGWAAERDFMISQGYDRPEYLVDASYSSISDMSQLVERRPSPEFFRATREEARAAVDEYAYEIGAVRDELLYSRRIDGPAVRRAMQTGVLRRQIADLTASTPAPEPTAGRASATATTVSTGGSTTMATIDEIRQSIGLSTEKAQYIAAALQQAVIDIGEIKSMLGGALQGTTNTDAEQVLATFEQLDEQIQQAHMAIPPALNALNGYAAHL